ncbi:MAG: lipid-A-disaccharide synthase N-terminal domain-containing protein [Thermoanaerobaculia bacterium]|nr:lipid-A-disaccharide synthase N-terminal domain-containing protein [Thermoanaerobaculia bacterium]
MLLTLDPRSWDFWVAFGLAGQLIFGSRFIVQWVVSEKKKVSHIPLIFWYLSLMGGIVTLIYAVHRRDPVFILGQGAGLLVYVRNLMLIYRHGENAQPDTTDPAPPDRA